MKKALRLAALLAMPLFAQEKAGSWVGVPLGNGKALRVSTEVSGANNQTLSIRAAINRSQANLFHRVLLDSASQVIFAYDLEITDPAALPLRIELKPVSSVQASATFSGSRTIVLAGPGERASVELLVNPQTHQKIADVLEIAESPSSAFGTSGGVAGPGKARQLSLSHADLFEDGVRITPSSANAIRGDVVMLYLPNHGGFFFTREEPKGYGFLKVGVVNGNRLRFNWGDHAYECVSATPILPESSDQQIWVYLDPHYQPRGPLGLPPASGFRYGAADSVKTLLGDRE
jgi:hypothetical protein